MGVWAWGWSDRKDEISAFCIIIQLLSVMDCTWFNFFVQRKGMFTPYGRGGVNITEEPAEDFFATGLHNYVFERWIIISYDVELCNG